MTPLDLGRLMTAVDVESIEALRRGEYDPHHDTPSQHDDYLAWRGQQLINGLSAAGFQITTRNSSLVLAPVQAGGGVEAPASSPPTSATTQTTPSSRP